MYKPGRVKRERASYPSTTARSSWHFNQEFILRPVRSKRGIASHRLPCHDVTFLGTGLDPTAYYQPLRISN